MSAVVAGVVISATSLAYSITSSQQQARIASQRQDAANQDAITAQNVIKQKQKADQLTQERNLALSNERSRASAPLMGVTSGAPAAAPASSPSTVARSGGTLLGT